MRYNNRVMKRPLKPRVLGDVSVKKANGRSWSSFGPLAARVNLVEERIIRIPLTKSATHRDHRRARRFFWFFGSVAAPTLFTKASGDANGTTATSTDPTAERTQLESQLAQLEDQINQYQGQISSYQTQGKTLNGQISILNDKIASLNLQIQATTLTFQQLNSQITATQSQITTTQADIVNKQAAMGVLMQELLPGRPRNPRSDISSKSAPFRFLG